MATLIDLGAWIDEVSDDGATALAIACQEGHIDAVRLLLSRGASPIKPDRYGLAPIEVARRCRQAEIAKAIRDFLDNSPRGPTAVKMRQRAMRGSQDSPMPRSSGESSPAELSGSARRSLSRGSNEEYKAIMTQIYDVDLRESKKGNKSPLRRTPSGGRSKATAALLNIFRKKDEKQRT